MMNEEKYDKIFQRKYYLDRLDDIEVHLDSLYSDLDVGGWEHVGDPDLPNDPFKQNFEVMKDQLNDLRDKVFADMQRFLGDKPPALPEDQSLEKLDAINRILVHIENVLVHKVSKSHYQETNCYYPQEIDGYFYYPMPMNIVAYFHDNLHNTVITLPTFKCAVSTMPSQKHEKPIIYESNGWPPIEPIYTRESHLEKPELQNYSNTLIALYRIGLLDWDDMVEMKAIEFKWGDKNSVYFIFDAMQTEGSKA